MIYSDVLSSLPILVFTHHIGSESNPDLGPELPGCSLNSFVLHTFLFSFLQAKLYHLPSASANRKSIFSNPHLFKGNFLLYPFRFITCSRLHFQVDSTFLSFLSFFLEFTSFSVLNLILLSSHYFLNCNLIIHIFENYNETTYTRQF